MKENILEKLPGAKKSILLKDYTTYKIGGPAKYFFIAKTEEDLINAVKTAKNLKLRTFILGGGSNVLVSDKGFNGLVIKVDIQDIKFEGSQAFVGAGANLTKLAYLSADKGFKGLEWSAGVPGTVGGAIYGHAQAFGTKISEVIKTVETMDAKTLKLENFTKEQCQFHTKDSIFKENRSLVIISAVLEFKADNPIEIKNRIKKFLEYRKAHHPMEFPSAGSVFINPEIKIEDKKLLEKFPELNEYNKKEVIPAGYLIEKAGLLGKKIGGAQISEKHANFMINIGGRPGGPSGSHPAKDVLSLINLAKKKVKKIFGIELEPEVQMIGF